MSSKRYIVFVDSPTIQDLRNSTIQDNLAWETIKCFYPRESLSSLTHHTTEFDKSCVHQPDQSTSISSSLELNSSTCDHNQHSLKLLHNSNDSENDTIQCSKRIKLDHPYDKENVECTVPSSNDTLNVDRTNILDSDNIDYFQTQLDYHDSLIDDSGDLSSIASPVNRTSCLLPHTQQSHSHSSISSTKFSTSQSSSNQTPTQQTSYSESMVINPPQWYFDARSCTTLDQINQSSEQMYKILFYLNQKTPLTTIELKKNRKNGLSTANLAHFECLDDTGSSIKLVLWDEVAESLDSACLVGDIIYLSGIVISFYKGQIQASSTHGTRAQICYRLRPTHQSHLQMFCPDMRLVYDPTTRRVKELVDWAKQAFF